MTADPATWLRCGHPLPDPRQRLVCFPHAGGSAAFFRDWGKHLPEHEVHAVCYPGRAERLAEPPATRLRDLAEQIAEALLPLADRPLALFGHSMGAVVALETARSLQARGVRPSHLFASGSRTSDHPPEDVAGDAEHDAAPQGEDPDDAETIARLLELGGTDPEMAADPDFQELVLPYVRADSELFHTYRHRPRPLLHCPVTTIVGDADPDADHRPWDRLTDAHFREHTVSGDHFYLLHTPPHALIRAALEAPPPPLDPELAGPLHAALATLPRPLTPALVPDRRARSAAGRLPDEELRRGGAFELTERLAPGPPGAPEVPLLLLRPTATPGPHPVIYHTHGGGMVAGSPRSRELAGELDRAQELGGVAVVAVDYRLAPEHPDPAPVEDCYAGLRWLHAHAAALGLDPDRIILSGTSAGGCLAAGLALLARDRHGPRPLGQMLLCPMLDDRCDTPSAAQLATVGMWDGESNRAGWTALLGERRGTDAVTPYAAPARAAELAGLPPAFLDVGAVEALRDETVAHATRIWQAGGDAELHVWSGAFHSFDEWVPEATVSRAAHRARLAWLRRLLRREAEAA